MDLLQRINECKEFEVNSIIDVAIAEANNNSEKVGQLGFTEGTNFKSVFKGFIPLNTRIKYESAAMEDYSMNTKDFMYEFAGFVKEHKISTRAGLVCSLETYINSYFGLRSNKERWEMFAEKTKGMDDDEYFKALENFKIGDFKGKRTAQCTERAAMAQQILSLYGVESYYCIGCINNHGKTEQHAFNVVKRENDYALLDYSSVATMFTPEGKPKLFLPFIGSISNEEFNDFMNNKLDKTFQNYYYVGKDKKLVDDARTYIVGELNLENKKGIGSL